MAKDGKKTENTAHMLDETDHAIIEYFTSHGRDSARVAAKNLKMHPTTLLKRLERMESSGIIRNWGAGLDLTKLGYEFLALIDITISKGHLLEVENKLSSMPEVVSVYDVTGEKDAVILVACKNRAEFSRLIKKILHESFIERTNTHVVLNVVKETWQFKP